MPLGAHRHGAVPAPLSRAGCSRQFGRASAPMIPQRVQSMRAQTVLVRLSNPDNKKAAQR
jgi:hypothetical protein